MKLRSDHPRHAWGHARRLCQTDVVAHVVEPSRVESLGHVGRQHAIANTHTSRNELVHAPTLTAPAPAVPIAQALEARANLLSTSPPKAGGVAPAYDRKRSSVVETGATPRPDLNPNATTSSSNAGPSLALERHSDAIPFGSSLGAHAAALSGGAGTHLGTAITHAASRNRARPTVFRLPGKSMIVVGSAAAFIGSFAKTSSAPRVPSDSAPTPADLIAAQRAAANPSASLDRFALINLHQIPPATTSGNSDQQRFHFGDAAIGAAVMAGLVLLGIAAGLFAARRRRQPLHT